MERELKPLERLGRAIAASQEEAIAPIVEQARSRLRAQPPAPARAPRRAWAAALAAVAAVAAFVFVIHGRARAPLTFEVANAHGVVGTWFLAPEGEQVPMRFSDGATVLLSPRAHGQVVEVTPDGARVTITRGRAAVSVPRTPGVRYRFDVGPFAVAVTGTRFDTSWDPASEVFELDLQDGSVRVSGPTLDGERVVVAGQRLRIALAVPESAISDGDVDAEAEADAPANADALAPAPSEEEAAPSPVRALASAAPHAPAPIASGPPAWRKLADDGRYAEALAAASARFDVLVSTSPAGDVVALADTARLGGDPARAKRAYQAARSRFPGSTDAALAAFWLGRMAAEAKDDVEAARWFETFLRERPDDRLAREALGRLMEARDRHGDVAAAQALAAQYLAKYPDGPHAKLARKLEER